MGELATIDLSAPNKAKAVACLVQGLSVAEAARAAGVKASTIHTWKKSDEVFQEMLLQAEEIAINAVIEDGVANVRTRIKELGPKALDVLTEALDSNDERTRLQAAREVFRISGVVSNEIQVKLGIERVLSGLGDSPAAGD